jgi:predicted RNA-binding protein YlxR (DUF448 family)
VGKQQQTRRKHIPQRTCIACREIAGKRGLIRLVRTPEGVQIDPTGKKLAGRGAYLHPQQRCWRQALESRRIEQALRTKLSAADRERLETFMATLPETDVESTPEGDA